MQTCGPTAQALRLGGVDLDALQRPVQPRKGNGECPVAGAPFNDDPGRLCDQGNDSADDSGVAKEVLPQFVWTGLQARHSGSCRWEEPGSTKRRPAACRGARMSVVSVRAA